MTISDAYVTVTCDECHHEEQVELTALTRGAYDMRNVARALDHLGWVKRGDQDICEGCAEEEQSE